MEWYGPLTVLPAIGLLIMSTSNFITSLNEELFKMELAEKPSKTIIQLKLEQLKKLGIAIAYLYASSLLFLIAGLSKAIFTSDIILKVFMVIGVFCTAIALGYLFVHSFKAVGIRQKHLNI